MSSELPKRDLNKYGRDMAMFVEELKCSVGKMKDEEVGMMIEENKVCKAMFQQVFNVLVTEQVRRMNLTEDITMGISMSSIEEDSKSS